MITTTGDMPEFMYVAVFETENEDGIRTKRYTRPYDKLKTARMRLTSIAREVDMVDSWVEKVGLTTGHVLDAVDTGTRRKCNECRKVSTSVMDRTLYEGGGVVRYCVDCHDRVLERIAELTS